MDCANSLLQLVNNLWGLASIPLGYTCNLKDNVISLRNANDNLKAKSGDVLARVEREEEGGDVQRTREVANWLDKVHEFAGGGDQVLREAEERDQIKRLNRCLPWNCWSSYKLGKRVDETLKKARELLPKEGEFGILTSPLPPCPVLEMPMDKTVGLDISFSEVWKWLTDETQVGMIGLYGIGGVGKTTLMKRIQNDCANNGFDVVIWVVVSRQVNIDSIRDTIRKRLDIQDERWDRWSQDERVHHLCHVLTQKKFVLLIDDVWRRLDLSNIGVPHPGLKNGSKVVFTTRLKHVCDQMGANKTLEVQCLAAEEALELFEKNFGKSLVDCPQEIRDLAKDIADECKGLPLALVTVGRAMARKDNPSEWRHALTMLRNNPYKLSGMVEEVYHILEFSYNNLNDPTLQACFLYCCLFPEDYLVSTNELIELWIGAGLLEDTNDVYRMRDEGESVLGDLQRACLLEHGYNSLGMDCVKMHDVIRDMATWIACDHGQRENKLLVIEKEDDMSAKMISKWGEAEKVSLWGKWIQNIDQTPPMCSKLGSLIVRETYVRLMPRGFFTSMVARLTVLDLSDNRNIELFPEEICNLTSLQYLNLSGTRICELPKEIKNLTRLRWLLLNNTTERILIPTEAIASLSLNGFSQWKLIDFMVYVPPRIVCEFDHSPLGLVNEEEVIEELEHMQHLTDLSINVSKSSSILKIFQSPNLQKCIKRARIIDCQEDLTRIVINYSPIGNGVFSHLKELYIQNCRVFREMEITHGIGQAPNCSCFPNLVAVCVERCGLSDLSWLVHAPKLCHLVVVDCDSVETIIRDGFAVEKLAASGLFSCLEDLVIMNLPNLTSIYDQTLPFPQLELLAINECPRLRKLPVNSNSARGSLRNVLADASWWAKLEWEDDAARANFTAQFEKDKGYSAIGFRP
ncbi:hypothetical protein BT93_F1986 [Corymbia citriodora subsp. variegata]|nr:hypothetical protein BT93_F1986 [Corymbia citriodora subsp. variegata]